MFSKTEGSGVFEGGEKSGTQCTLCTCLTHDNCIVKLNAHQSNYSHYSETLKLL